MALPQLYPSRVLVTFLVVMGACACSQSTQGTADRARKALAGCLASGDGALQAELRGALVANLAWQDAQMQCEGDPRPDGNGIRVTIAGPLPGTDGAAPAQLRFIFGIDLHDTASGMAQAFPTNLTVIVEGGKQLYATRGDDKCAVETLQRTPLQASGGRLDRIKARGYCIGPASDLAGDTRLHVPTFSFTAVVRNGDEP